MWRGDSRYRGLRVGLIWDGAVWRAFDDGDDDDDGFKERAMGNDWLRSFLAYFA